jgi:hypothetical protein
MAKKKSSGMGASKVLTPPQENFAYQRLKEEKARRKYLTETKKLEKEQNKAYYEKTTAGKVSKGLGKVKSRIEKAGATVAKNIGFGRGTRVYHAPKTDYKGFINKLYGGKRK